MKFNLSKFLSLQTLITELSIGLTKLNLTDNFEAREIEVVIPATSEAKIQHNLGFVPKRYLIVDFLGNGVISRGTNSWDRTFAYLYNYGTDQATLKVIFYK